MDAREGGNERGSVSWRRNGVTVRDWARGERKEWKGQRTVLRGTRTGVVDANAPRQDATDSRGCPRSVLSPPLLLLHTPASAATPQKPRLELQARRLLERGRPARLNASSWTASETAKVSTLNAPARVLALRCEDALPQSRHALVVADLLAQLPGLFPAEFPPLEEAVQLAVREPSVEPALVELLLEVEERVERELHVHLCGVSVAKRSARARGRVGPGRLAGCSLSPLAVRSLRLRMPSIVDTVLHDPRKRVLAADDAVSRPLKRTKHSLARNAQRAHAGTVGLAGTVNGESARLVTRSPETGAQGAALTLARSTDPPPSPARTALSPSFVLALDRDSAHRDSFKALSHRPLAQQRLHRPAPGRLGATLRPLRPRGRHGRSRRLPRGRIHQRHTTQRPQGQTHHRRSQ